MGLVFCVGIYIAVGVFVVIWSRRRLERESWLIVVFGVCGSGVAADICYGSVLLLVMVLLLALQFCGVFVGVDGCRRRLLLLDMLVGVAGVLFGGAVAGAVAAAGNGGHIFLFGIVPLVALIGG